MHKDLFPGGLPRLLPASNFQESRQTQWETSPDPLGTNRGHNISCTHWEIKCLTFANEDIASYKNRATRASTCMHILEVHPGPSFSPTAAWSHASAFSLYPGPSCGPYHMLLQWLQDLQLAPLSKWSCFLTDAP